MISVRRPNAKCFYTDGDNANAQAHGAKCPDSTVNNGTDKKVEHHCNGDGKERAQRGSECGVLKKRDQRLTQAEQERHKN